MQKKYLYAIVAILIVVVAIALIAYTSLGTKPGGTGGGVASYDNQLVPASLIAQLRVPGSAASSVNATQEESNGVIVPITKTDINASPLTINGKPEILYIGAEYCPYCGAERWAMVIALLRFGNFTGLKYMTSSSTDADPDTPTFTFYNSTYSSPYIVFVSVETTTNEAANSLYTGKTVGGYPALQTPNASENNLISAYDTGGSIPFIDIANSSVQVGASYNPQLILGGLNWTQVGNDVNNPSSLQAQAILSTANLMTAQICKADGNLPQSVCGQPYIKRIEK